MKANEFVKSYGFDYTLNVLKTAPTQANYVEWYPLRSRFYVSDFGCNRAVLLSDLKRLVESHELIRKVDFYGRIDKGLIKAKIAIDNNTLQASYYQPSSGSYYRYGHGSIYIVKDGKWKEIYTGMDSNSLIHTDKLKQAISDVESCQ